VEEDKETKVFDNVFHWERKKGEEVEREEDIHSDNYHTHTGIERGKGGGGERGT
jgi:hypothetical protein